MKRFVVESVQIGRLESKKEQDGHPQKDDPTTARKKKQIASDKVGTQVALLGVTNNFSWCAEKKGGHDVSCPYKPSAEREATAGS
ncbi:MAG TPA: hypothetical protein VNH65_02120 [Candidatus Acidoferrum sp.]|nr:hypothetical protein [Candidatus Acidoferrum sp.]